MSSVHLHFFLLFSLLSIFLSLLLFLFNAFERNLISWDLKFFITKIGLVQENQKILELALFASELLRIHSTKLCNISLQLDVELLDFGGLTGDLNCF
jgi:hypothetical protein